MSALFPNPFSGALTASLTAIMTWIVGRIVDGFTAVFAATKGILVSTPDITKLPQVQTITGHAVAILDAVFVLAFLAAGALTIFAGGDEQARYTAKHLMPRIIVAFVVAHFSPLFCSMIIQLVDAVAVDLAGGHPDRLGALSAIAGDMRGNALADTSPLLFGICTALITFLLAAVAFSFITRLGVLLIIAVTGPLALACHALPQLDGIARLWWRALIGCLAIPLLQVLALQSGETILLDPHAAGALFGTPNDGVTSLLIVIALLWITVKIPGLVRKHVTQSSGQSLPAQVVRVVVIQRLMRLLIGRP